MKYNTYEPKRLQIAFKNEKQKRKNTPAGPKPPPIKCGSTSKIINIDDSRFRKNSSILKIIYFNRKPAPFIVLHEITGAVGHRIAPDIVLVEGNLVGSVWLKRPLCVKCNGIVASIVYKRRNWSLKFIRFRLSVGSAPEVCLFAKILSCLPKEHFCVHHV